MANNIMALPDVFLTMNRAKTEGDRTRSQLRTLRTGLNAIVNSDALEGAQKTALNRVIEEQHIPLLQGQENAFFKIFHKARDMNIAFMDIMGERDQNAIYNHDFLEALEGDLREIHDAWLESNDEYERIYRSCSDEIELGMPNTNSYIQNYDSALDHARETRELLGGFNFSLAELDGLLDDLASYISQLEGVNKAIGIFETDRYNLMEGSRFGNHMRNMSASFDRREQENLDALRESWEGRCPFESFMSLPHPLTDAEWRAFRNFIHGVTYDWQYYQLRAMGNTAEGNKLLQKIMGKAVEQLLESDLGFAGLPIGNILTGISLVNQIANGQIGEAVFGTAATWGLAWWIKGLLAPKIGVVGGAVVGGITAYYSVSYSRNVVSDFVDQYRTGREAWGEVIEREGHMSSQIDWDWVEANYPDWWMQGLDVPTLYDKYQEHLRSIESPSSNRQPFQSPTSSLFNQQLQSSSIVFDAQEFVWWWS